MYRLFVQFLGSLTAWVIFYLALDAPPGFDGWWKEFVIRNAFGGLLFSLRLHVTQRRLERLVIIDCERKHPDLSFLRWHPGSSIQLDEQNPEHFFCAAPELNSWVEMQPRAGVDPDAVARSSRTFQGEN